VILDLLKKKSMEEINTWTIGVLILKLAEHTLEEDLFK
jgi:hypothetical protein